MMETAPGKSNPPIGDVAEIRELIDLIVERCREDGQLVTVNNHYAKGWHAAECGCFWMLGALSAVGMVSMVAMLFRQIL